MTNMEKILGNVDARIQTQKNDLIAYVARCEKERQDVLDGAEPQAIKQMRVEMYDQAIDISKKQLKDLYKHLSNIDDATQELFDAFSERETSMDLYVEYSSCGVKLVEHYRKIADRVYIEGALSKESKRKLDEYYEERERFFKSYLGGQEAVDLYVENQIKELTKRRDTLNAEIDALNASTEHECAEIQAFLDSDPNISDDGRKQLNDLLSKIREVKN